MMTVSLGILKVYWVNANDETMSEKIEDSVTILKVGGGVV